MAPVLQTKALPLPVIGYKLVTGTITFDNSYPAGGYAMDLSAELDTVIGVFFDGASLTDSTHQVTLAYDKVNKKVQAFRYDGASAGKAFLEEVTAAVDLSGVKKVGFLAIGFKS